MSEYIDNQTQRQQTLKRLIRELHEGKAVEDVKEDFAALLRDVSATEIAQMEQALIAEGLPETEVKRLCDVHVAVFRESLDTQARPETIPGHPVHTFRAENAAVEPVLDALQEALNALKEAPGSTDVLEAARQKLVELRAYESHYLRKENILFPYLEQHDFTGPSAVMWAIHDDVRAGWKQLDALLAAGPAGAPATFLAQLGTVFEALDTAIREMIYKEENILFPAALEKLSDTEWAAVRGQEAELGFAYVEPGADWPPEGLAQAALGAELPPRQAQYARPLEKAGPTAGQLLQLDTGALTAREVNAILTHLPVDVTYVDADDSVRYFSQTPERIFPRSPAIIGRKVQKCHPPASVHRVQQILDDFRAGRRDEAEFWIQMNDKFIHIRYFAVRDERGTYQGTLEVSQEVSHIRALEGERRLLDDLVR